MKRNALLSSALTVSAGLVLIALAIIVCVGSFSLAKANAYSAEQMKAITGGNNCQKCTKVMPGCVLFSDCTCTDMQLCELPGPIFYHCCFYCVRDTATTYRTCEPGGPNDNCTLKMVECGRQHIGTGYCHILCTCGCDSSWGYLWAPGC
jgi:hypothetical protein